MTDETLVMEILQELLKINTVNPPGNERAAAVYLQQLFLSHNIACEVQELGEHRANFIAEWGEGKKTLEFNGHLDVVPYGNGWHYAPLEATEENGKIYGRGACDMKGGAAAMCAAVLMLAKEGKKLNGKLRLVFVADEEHVNLGIRAFQANHSPADYAVIGEPTNLRVAVAHRGVARFFVDLHGEERHAALPQKSESAIVLAAQAVLALERMNRTLQAQTHEVLPSPSITVTMLHGYEKDNVVPETVRLLTDYRLFPDTTEEQAKNEIEMALQSAGIQNYTLEKRHFMSGGALPVANAFAQKCSLVTNKVLKHKDTPCRFDASCEQCFLLSAGVETVICGPGSLAQAHSTDEFVEKQQLLDAVACYKALAQEILK